MIYMSSKAFSAMSTMLTLLVNVSELQRGSHYRLMLCGEMLWLYQDQLGSQSAVQQTSETRRCPRADVGMVCQGILLTCLIAGDESFSLSAVEGVTLYISDFKRSLTDKLAKVEVGK